MRAAKSRHDAIQTLQRDLLRPKSINPHETRELTHAISNLTLNPPNDEHPHPEPPDPDPTTPADQEPQQPFPTDERNLHDLEQARKTDGTNAIQIDETDNKQTDALEYDFTGMALKKQKISQPNESAHVNVCPCSVQPTQPARNQHT